MKSNTESSNTSPAITPRSRYAIILAAGKGTRFKSGKAKVLHTLCGMPMVGHVLDKLADLGIDRTLTVVGHQADSVQKALVGYQTDFVLQEPQLGTGHALLVSLPILEKLSGDLLVLYGDTPLISKQTLQNLFATREQQNADLALLTCPVEDAGGYGRILRDAAGNVSGIVEARDASPDQLAIREINPGFYCFKIESLLPALRKLTPQNAQGEYYLTDVVEIFRSGGKRIAGVAAASATEIAGINDRRQLAEAEVEMRIETARYWMTEGVTIIDPKRVYIDRQVRIGLDTILYPGVRLEGECDIGPECTIFSNSHLRNARLEANVTVDHCSVIRESSVGQGTAIGPFAHLRQNAQVGPSARIGNFVEVKKSVIGEGSKASHLAYLGDATVGRKVNIGAGTITCNYDGIRKNPTVIEDGVFIGSDSQLVAPVTIHEGAYVAAGSSITEDVPAYSLGIARSRQTIKENWVREKGKKNSGSD